MPLPSLPAGADLSSTRGRTHTTEQAEGNQKSGVECPVFWRTVPAASPARLTRTAPGALSGSQALCLLLPVFKHAVLCLFPYVCIQTYSHANKMTGLTFKVRKKTNKNDTRVLDKFEEVRKKAEISCGSWTA